MRDLLPMEARERADLMRRVMGTFDLFGYQRVVLPFFEHVRVLECGLGPLDTDEVLQFVEPETGAVVAFRPDMTPQVARLLVTRLVEQPSPARLSYEGSVLRRRRVRARRHRQIPQAGIELLGAGSQDGDLEVLEVAATAARAAGLQEFALDLGHVGITRALLEGVAPSVRSELVESLALKDSSTLVRRAEKAGLRGQSLRAIAELPGLHGGSGGTGDSDDVWRRAIPLLTGTAALEPAMELRQLWETVKTAELVPTLLVDLGEVSNFEYYTGMTFELLAEGPGEAVASGGRYDDLLGRFGEPRPAAGCAFDLDNLGWALARAGVHEALPCRVLVALEGDARSVAAELRGQGISAVVAGPGTDPLALGRAWGYSHWVRTGPQGVVVADLVYGTESPVSGSTPQGVASAIGRLVGSWQGAAPRR